MNDGRTEWERDTFRQTDIDKWTDRLADRERGRLRKTGRDVCFLSIPVVILCLVPKSLGVRQLTRDEVFLVL